MRQIANWTFRYPALSLIVLLMLQLGSSTGTVAPFVPDGGIVDAASYRPVVAPGIIFSIFGQNLAPVEKSAERVPLPYNMGGVSVQVQDPAGVVHECPLYYVAPGQINGQLPYAISGSWVRMRVSSPGGLSPWQKVALDEQHPSLFTSRINGRLAPTLLHNGGSTVDDSAPARSGDYVTAFLTGLGSVDPPVNAGEPAPIPRDGRDLSHAVTPVEVHLGPQKVPVLFAGLAPQWVGLYQINFQVGDGLRTGMHDLLVQAGQKRSQPGLFVSVAAPAAPREFYVSPNGRAGGSGGRGDPWSLAHALSHPNQVQPGDTIWLLEGTYGDGRTVFQSSLRGTPDRAIVVRQARGERATINGGLMIRGAHTWYWGFEVTSSLGPARDGGRGAPDGISLHAPGAKLVNLVIHDTAQGVGFWDSAENSEIYGCLIYFNGYQGETRGHGHGVYTQNRAGIKRIHDNILFHSFAIGIHGFGSGSAGVEGYDVRGNISFESGSVADKAQRIDNILFAGGRGLRDIVVEDNYTYYAPGTPGGQSRLGWQFDSANANLTARRNYWIGGFIAIELWRWSSLTYIRNVAYSENDLIQILETNPDQSTDNYTFDGNTYYGSGIFRFKGRNANWQDWRERAGVDPNSSFQPGPPQSNWVFVRPNRHEPGRAHIVIYNWERRSAVPVDISGIVAAGDAYEIRDAQNFFGPPALAGVADGNPVLVPMNGRTIAAPVGSVPTAPRHTAPQFAAFVVISGKSL